MAAKSRGRAQFGRIFAEVRRSTTRPPSFELQHGRTTDSTTAERPFITTEHSVATSEQLLYRQPQSSHRRRFCPRRSGRRILLLYDIGAIRYIGQEVEEDDQEEAKRWKGLDRHPANDDERCRNERGFG